MKKFSKISFGMGILIGMFIMLITIKSLPKIFGLAPEVYKVTITLSRKSVDGDSSSENLSSYIPSTQLNKFIKRAELVYKNGLELGDNYYKLSAIIIAEPYDQESCFLNAPLKNEEYRGDIKEVNWGMFATSILYY